MYYLIHQTLTPVSFDQFRQRDTQFVAVLTSAEWQTGKDSFDMGIDIEPQTTEIHSTKAEVNYDSLTGTFSIPDRYDPEEVRRFAFAMDEKGIVFIDDSGAAEKIIEQIRRTKKWRFPGLERFIYDFLEQIVADDRDLIERYDSELGRMEAAIVGDEGESIFESVNDMRDIIRVLRVHYEQLLDFTQELEENENSFFKAENLRYFRLFGNRIMRLRDSTVAIGEHAGQLRDIYKSHLDIKQNRIMTVLTIVTTIFMPLTLIAGWYGMNFRFMPELNSVWGYPVVIALSLLIVVGSLLFFKKIKWL